MDNKKEPKTVGERIKLLREKNGESQAELGNAIGLSQNSISKLEKGDTQLTLDNQLRIAEHFNVSHDFLCTGKDKDSILETLKKYVSLKYKNLSDDTEAFIYPVLEINNVFFNYLIQSARAQSERYMPPDVRELWLEKEINNFYERNKENTFTNFESLVPLPEKLIYPEEQKCDWNQTDLLRKLNKQLLNYSTASDKE